MQKNGLKICKKITNLLLISLLLCAQMSAYSGFLNGEKNLRVAKTKWFDIIYPQRCEESAAILYENADRVYEEITAEYGLTPSFRMPVVITPSVEQFNAFWTAVPYNHIAMFDTGSSGSSDLAVFSETFLSTFRHELTHAVTYNMKNGFWRGLDKVFGDCVVPGMLAVTTGMAEGATVAMESSAGEGRLNSEFTTHYVKQAKIEDDFPAYHDVSGSADIQPGTAPYYFNGAFHAWLQEKYGLNAYANFWYRVVNGKNFTISGAFKKSFGVKLKEAWRQFEKEYDVPDIPANPVRAGLVKDFFEPEGQDYSRLNDAGSYFASLTEGGGRLVWLDYFGSRVFEATENGQIGQAGDAGQGVAFRQVFAQQGLTGVRLSEDGRFLAVNYVSSNAASQKVRTKLYDFETKSFFTVKETGLKDPVVVGSGGGRYLVAQKYFAQHYSLVAYRLLFSSDGRRITGLEPFTELKLEPEVNPYAFTPLPEDFSGDEAETATFAWLKKDRLSYSLCISSVDGSLLQEFSFPEGTFVNSLSYSSSDSSFYFSYVQKGTMPRLGALRISGDDAALGLSTLDLSGGIFEPVSWKGQLVYVGEFLRMSRLLCLEDLEGLAGLEGLDFEEAVAEENSEKVAEAGVPEDVGAALAPSASIPSKAYNPFPYLVHGIFIPISDYATDTFDNGDFDTNALLDNFYLGATYITANPWANGSSDLYTITGGFNTVTKTFGTALTVSKGTATSLVNSKTTVKSEFNEEGWKQGGLGLDLSFGYELGRISYIALSNSANALASNQEIFSLSDVVTLAYSNARRSGPGRFERSGITASVSYGKWYEASFSDPGQEIYETSALAAGLRVYLPRLLPFESKYGYTFNLPFTALARLLPGTSNYAYVSFGEEVETNKERTTTENSLGQVIFDVEAEITVFSMDIQKAIPFATAFYLSEFYVNGGYAAAGTAGSATKDGFQTANLGEYFPALVNGKGYYLDSVFAKAQLDFVPNIGLFANAGYKMGIYALYSYTLHSSKDLSAQERLRLTLGLDLNF